MFGSRVGKGLVCEWELTRFGSRAKKVPDLGVKTRMSVLPV